MRIAIFSDNFYPELTGIGDTVTMSAVELSKRGHQIHFFAPRYSAKDYGMANLSEKEMGLGENIKITRFFSLPYKTGTGQGRFVIPTCLRWINIKKFNPDIIHTHLPFGVGIEALVAARILRKPLIGTNHTNYGVIRELSYYSFLPSGLFEKISTAYFNWYYKHCDLITSPAAFILETMRNHGVRRPSVVVHNPVDLATFNPLKSRSGIKRVFGLSHTAVASAGRLAPEKKIEVIIKAVAIVKKKIPALTLGIAGHGIIEDDLKELVKNLGLEDNVKFLGILNKTELNGLYSASKMFIITSISEVQSMTVLQAMASALPVIGVQAAGLEEYITPGTGILVNPGDPEALAQKVIYLLRHPEVRRKLGRRGQNFVKKFAVTTIADVWEKIYEKTIEEYNQKR